jgi:YHS domain-containing protein
MKKLLLIFLTIISFGALAQTQDFREKNYNIESNKLAIDGYDPVAYFTQAKAVKGKSAYRISDQGIIYQFASKENLELFKKDAAHYEPQYGGWCAYAMGATGEKVEVDPETFKIIDGKLYLYYNRLFNNTLTDWNKNEAKLKAVADKNWSKFK